MFTVQNNIKTAYFDRNRKKSIYQSNYLHYQCPKKGTLNSTSRPPIIELPKVWTRNSWIRITLSNQAPSTPPPTPQQTHKTQLFHRDDIFLPVYVLIDNQVIFGRHCAMCRNVFRITINSANMGHPKHSQFLVLIYM